MITWNFTKEKVAMSLSCLFLNHLPMLPVAEVGGWQHCFFCGVWLEWKSYCLKVFYLFLLFLFWSFDQRGTFFVGTFFSGLPASSLPSLGCMRQKEKPKELTTTLFFIYCGPWLVALLFSTFQSLLIFVLHTTS